MSGSIENQPTYGMMSIPEMNDKLEKLRTSLNDPTKKLTKDAFIILISELQPLYTKLIMTDIESATKRQLENFLWNDCFKTPLTKLMRTDKILFNFVIETGIGFYLGFIHDIGIHFDVPFIKYPMRSMYCTAPKMKQVVKCNPSKTIVYYIIQNSLIHMGDLLRYGGGYPEALKMYDKSTALSPSNGHPYNQLGLVQLLIDSKTMDSLLNGIYYYVRAVCTSIPFLLAQQNLDGLLSKVKNVNPTTQTEELFSIFLIGIGKLDDVVPLCDILTKNLTSLILSNSITFQQIIQIFVIAIWAWKREASQSLMGVDLNYESQALELIASLMNGVLCASVELGDNDGSIFHCISFLNIALEWIRLNLTVANDTKFRTKLNMEILVDFLNHIESMECNNENAVGLDHVILPEEKKLLGFTPISRAFEHLQSVMEESDPRINSLRIIHILKVSKKLCEVDSTFIEYNNGKYTQVSFISYQPSAIQIRAPCRPNRRNVALQSIFNQFNSMESTRNIEPTQFEPPTTALPPPLTSVSARNTPQELNMNDDDSKNNIFEPNVVVAVDVVNNEPPTSITPQDVSSYFCPGKQRSTPGTPSLDVISLGGLPTMEPSNTPYPPPGFTSKMNDNNIPSPSEPTTIDIDTNGFSHLFHSIWTPLQPESQSNVGHNIWNF